MRKRSIKKDYESFWDNFITKPEEFMQSPIEPFNNPIRVRIAQETEIGNSVLDVGSASCISYPLFKDKKDYVGMDFTLKFLKTAKQNRKELKVVHGDARQLPFVDNSFDSAYCKDVFDHLAPEDYKKVILEMWRVTKKQILLVYGLNSRNNKTEYNIYVQHPEHPEQGVFYASVYDRNEIMAFVSQLPNCDSCKIVDGIQLENSTTFERELIIVKKHEK